MTGMLDQVTQRCFLLLHSYYWVTVSLWDCGGLSDETRMLIHANLLQPLHQLRGSMHATLRTAELLFEKKQKAAS